MAELELEQCRILITNDDGIDAPGIARLEKAVSEFCRDIWVVAPAANQSSCSRRITQHRKVVCKQRGPRRFAVEGTPADCSIVALNGLIPGRRPDLVLSGVNHGANLGEDLALSGTVGACLQAVEQGIPGIAFSQVKDCALTGEDLWHCSDTHLASLLPRLVSMLDESCATLNVNFPPLRQNHQLNGVVVVPTGRRRTPIKLDADQRDNGETHFYYPTLRQDKPGSPGSDLEHVYSGCITVTPIQPDLTHHASLKNFSYKLSAT